MSPKCDYPGCPLKGLYGTYYIKQGQKRWGLFCDKHERQTIADHQVKERDGLDNLE